MMPPPVFTHSGKKSILQHLKEVWQWKYLLFTLVMGAIKNDKRNTFLGNLWHLLNPIIQMFIFMFVFQYIFKGRQPHYPLFFLSGMMFFRFMTISMAQGSELFYREAVLLKVCAFPRLLVVFSCVFKNLYYLLIEWGVVLLLMFFYGVAPTGEFLALIPFMFFLTMGVLGLVMMAACFGTLFPDLGNIVMHLNRMLFYFTPIMYPLHLVTGKLRNIYLLNPAAAMVETGRSLILGQPLSGGLVLYLSAFLVLSFFTGLFIFSQMERKICKLI